MTVHAQTLNLHHASVIVALHQITWLLELRLGHILIGVGGHCEIWDKKRGCFEGGIWRDKERAARILKFPLCDAIEKYAKSRSSVKRYMEILSQKKPVSARTFGNLLVLPWRGKSLCGGACAAD